MTCPDERGRGWDSHGELWNGYYTQSYISEELASRWATTWIPDLSALSFVWTDLEFHARHWIPAFIWDFYFSRFGPNSETKQKKKKGEKKFIFLFFYKCQSNSQESQSFLVYFFVNFIKVVRREILESSIAKSKMVPFIMPCSAQIISPLLIKWTGGHWSEGINTTTVERLLNKHLSSLQLTNVFFIRWKCHHLSSPKPKIMRLFIYLFSSQEPRIFHEEIEHYL